MSETEKDYIRNAVRENYEKIANSGASVGCCGPNPSIAEEVENDSCCGPSSATIEQVSAAMGYSDDEISAAPEGANMGLGCGNPTAIASLKTGETVIDLGAGGGFDVFLAARKVGSEGRVIGVDMTPAMVSKARKNAEKLGLKNVEFRLGEIENLPVADSTADVIISNCVINLSPDKRQVFRDAYRALKPGGRIAVSDIVALAEIPEEMKGDLNLISGCVAGAAHLEEVKKMLSEAGFSDARVEPKSESGEIVKDWVPGHRIETFIASAYITAVKKTDQRCC